MMQIRVLQIGLYEHFLVGCVPQENDQFHNYILIIAGKNNTCISLFDLTPNGVWPGNFSVVVSLGLVIWLAGTSAVHSPWDNSVRHMHVPAGAPSALLHVKTGIAFMSTTCALHV